MVFGDVLAAEQEDVPGDGFNLVYLEASYELASKMFFPVAW